VKYLAIGVVRLYQLLLSPLFPNSCKYHPSCSQYAVGALRQYGLVRGSVLSGWRLLRCNPWSHGGVDYPRDQKLFKQAGSRARRSAASPASPPAEAK
jgi:putative membrane protein insertion efficiency factor